MWWFFKSKVAALDQGTPAIVLLTKVDYTSRMKSRTIGEQLAISGVMLCDIMIEGS